MAAPIRARQRTWRTSPTRYQSLIHGAFLPETDESGSADQRVRHAERDFDRRCVAGERVDADHESPPEQDRHRQEAIEPRPGDEPRHMRHHPPDPADDAGDHDGRRGDQSRRDDDEAAQQGRVDTEGSRLLLAEAQHADAPAQQHKHAETEEYNLRNRQRPATVDDRERAVRPEGDGRKLLLRIGQNLDQRDRRSRQRSDHDTYDNCRTIPRTELEARVLAGLKDRMTVPEIVEEADAPMRRRPTG